MIDAINVALIYVLLALTAAGCVYTLVAVVAVGQLAQNSHPVARACPGVTILKPISGSAPGLHDDLASFCDQDYGGPVQLLFGVQDGADPATGIVEHLVAERRGRDIELVCDASGRGANPKMANVVALEGRIRHEVVILADADIGVRPDYLGEVVATLELPNVGGVTCLYRGVARGGLWARLASMGIDYHFLPSVLVGLRLGLARPCFGSTIALRRETLAAIGGFHAFVDYIADDYAIGEAIRSAGMKVAIPSLVVAHSCSEQSAAELLRHELRWARTLRAVDPLGYAGSVLTHALPLALLGAALTGFAPLGLAAIAAAFACRLVLQLRVDHTLGVNAGRWWLGPLRDLLAFAIHLASYFVDVVSWRGQRYRVRSDGTLAAVGDQKT
jgi:ceramide glucosyltransferase